MKSEIRAKRGARGVQLFDFDNASGSFVPRFPAIWPAGVRTMFPALEQWSASLISKEAGQ